MSSNWQDRDQDLDLDGKPHGAPAAEPLAQGDGQRAGQEDEPPAIAETLLLSDDNGRLPWLESDEDYEDETIPTSRIVLVALLGLLLVLAVVGAAWWLSRSAPEAELQPEGTVIAAPDAGFRVDPPADDEADGATGSTDVSFGTAEGQRPEGRIADPAPSAPAPAPAPTPAGEAAASAIASTTATAGPAPAASAAPASGVGVQVGAYSTRAAAQQGWTVLSRQYEVLSGVSHRVVEAQVDGATIYRLQALADTLAEAEALCRSLRAAGGDCQVKR